MADHNKSSGRRLPLKRGRPSKQEVEELIRNAKLHESLPGEKEIRCPDPKCNRVLPRNKSLNAHLKTHTGETPYYCTFPGCNGSFKQSGQLKTHIRTHTYERPYACPFAGCNVRYAHSNRKCDLHGKLIRDGKIMFDYSSWDNLSSEQLQWCKDYEKKENARQRENRSKRFRYASGSSGFTEGNSRSPTSNEQGVLHEDSQWNKENVSSNLPSVAPSSPSSSISASSASPEHNSEPQGSSGFAEENSRSPSTNAQSEVSRSPSSSSAYSSASPEYNSSSDESKPVPTYSPPMSQLEAGRNLLQFFQYCHYLAAMQNSGQHIS